MEFVAQFKAAIKDEILAELMKEYDIRPKVVAEPVAPAAVVNTYYYTKSTEWDAFTKETEAYNIFEKWYVVQQPRKYNAIRHAFNSIIKHQGFIQIRSDGSINNKTF
jgi:hypothetical protein